MTLATMRFRRQYRATNEITARDHPISPSKSQPGPIGLVRSTSVKRRCARLIGPGIGA